MSSTGSGIGGSVGGPIAPLPREIETTAWAENAKAFLAIQKDSLNIPFTQLGGNVWRYDTSTGHPVLPPMVQLRMDTELKETPDSKWRPHFEDLVNRLPLDMQARFMREMNLPADSKSPYYAFFEKFLVNLAKGLSMLHEASQPKELNASALKLQRIHQELLPATKESVDLHLKESQAHLNQFLEKAGANSPDFDSIHYHTEQMQRISTALQSPLNEKESAQLAEHSQRLSEQFDQVRGNESFQMRGAYLKALALLSASSLPSIARPSVLIGLQMATKGLGEGNLIEKGVQEFVNELLISWGDQSQGTEKMVRSSGLIGLLFSSALGFSLSHVTQLSSSMKEEKAPADLPLFSYDLILTFMVHSRCLTHLFEGILSASQEVGEGQRSLAEMLSGFSLFLTALTGTQGKAAYLLPLLNGMKGYFAQLLKREREEKDRRRTPLPKELALFLAKGEAALEMDDMSAFLQAWVEWMEALDGSNQTEEKLVQELKTLHDLGGIIKSSLMREDDLSKTGGTGIICAA